MELCFVINLSYLIKEKIYYFILLIIITISKVFGIIRVSYLILIRVYMYIPINGCIYICIYNMENQNYYYSAFINSFEFCTFRFVNYNLHTLIIIIFVCYMEMIPYIHYTGFGIRYHIMYVKVILLSQFIAVNWAYKFGNILTN